MLKRWPRRKPTRVMPKRCATSTARLDGAPTDARTGIAAITDFWTSSKEERCGMNSTCAVKGLLGPPEQTGETIDEGRVELRARLPHWKRRADFNRAYGKL